MAPALALVLVALFASPATASAPEASRSESIAADATIADPVAVTYGAAPALESEPLTLQEAVKSENREKPIRLRGDTAAVCKKKGCWLTIQDGETEVRVTFKDYAFFVPAEVAGRKVVVEGTLREEMVPEKDARHFAKDGGLPKAEIRKIKGPQRSFTMIATSVTVD